nr:hypothetical protein [Candidatus Sigynarchaeum springense]
MNRKYSFLVFSLIITIGIFVVIIALLGMNRPGRTVIPKEYMEFIWVVPGPIYTDMLLLFALPIGVFALIYVATPIISKILVFLHKIIMRGAKYGFAQLGGEIKTGSFLKRALYISLFAFNVSAILVGLGYGEQFRGNIGLIDPALTLNESEAVFLGTFLFATAGLFIFMPLWILEDSGLIMYRIFPSERRAPDIEGVHSLYGNLWKAYISISTLYTLWEYISKSFSVLNGIHDPAILTPIILCVLPFIIIGLVSVPMYLYEKYLPRLKNRVSSGLRSSNLPSIQIPDIRQIGVDHIKVE